MNRTANPKGQDIIKLWIYQADSVLRRYPEHDSGLRARLSPLNPENKYEREECYTLYYLPDGFSVGELSSGEPAIFHDDELLACDLVVGEDESIAVITAYHGMPKLQKAPDAR